jgi:hypothetical protein
LQHNELVNSSLSKIDDNLQGVFKEKLEPCWYFYNAKNGNSGKDGIHSLPDEAF